MTTTKTRIAGALPGYLHPRRRGTYSGTEQPIALMTACPCGRWHSHGAGTVQTPHPYRTGSITSRAGHCLTFDYRQIEIQPEPYLLAWQTPVGRITATYRATRPLGCPRCREMAAVSDLRKPRLGTCSTPDCAVDTWDRPTGVVLTATEV